MQFSFGTLAPTEAIVHPLEYSIFVLQACREKAAELRAQYEELRHLEAWAGGASDLELLNWMRNQHQMPPLVVGTFLVVLRILP